jgi:galactokinase
MNEIREIHKKVFGSEPQQVAFAHGRVNLIGEHTDYNGGFVLPTNIPQKTEVAISKRNDREVHLYSANFASAASPDLNSTKYTLGDEVLGRHWSDYIKGVTFVLQKDGYELSGFNCALISNVPIGSGLSSSAALEVAVLKGLSKLFNLEINPVEIAKLGQRVENDFVGARIGIMDQMVASLGTAGQALFIDTRDLSYKNLSLPTSEMELLVINSGVEHSNVHGDYNQRRSECEQACELLKVRQLRDLDIDQLDRLKPLPNVLARRARHVITENQRVLDAVKALQAGQYAKMGELFSASHASMRDDYKVSIPEIDTLVELTAAESGVLGARLTGGGFGGSIVALLKPGLGRAVGERVVTRYNEQTGKKATILVPEK